MSEKVVILMAFRGDGEGYGGKGWRDRAFTYVWDHLEGSWPIYTADSGDEPFHIAKSYNLAAQKAGKWDKAILHPPDEWVILDALDKALQLSDTAPGQVYAFDREVRLTEIGTTRFFEGKRMFVGGEVAERRPKPGKAMPAYSGPRVIRRDLWEQFGGFYEGTTGWGAEDRIFAHCAHIFGGKQQRIEGEMVSLYHPRHEAAPEAEREFFAHRKANTAIWKRIRLIKDPGELRKALA